MTNAEKFGEFFHGFELRDNPINYNGIPVSCEKIRCSQCPIENDCSVEGFCNWLKKEYDGNEKGYDEGYKKGFEEGKAEVYKTLSQIFLRKEEQ